MARSFRHATTPRRPSWMIGAVVACLFASACGGTKTPSGSAPVATQPVPSSSGATSPADPSSGAGLEGFPEVSMDDPDGPVTAARQELDLTRQLRAEARVAAFLGPDGTAALEALDRIESEFGTSVLRDVAAAVESGTFPTSAVDPLTGQVASLAGPPPPARPPSTIGVSMFAETGFTTSAVLQVLSGLVSRADQNQNGTLPRQESHEETSNGLTQKVEMNMTISIRTGEGRVSADITMTATDRVFDASGSFVALYTSTSTGHFDAEACPKEGGLAAGTYTFETKHELNDVATATAARSGAGRSAESPFTMKDGPDAHLIESVANMGLEANAFGPGESSGGAYDWGAGQQVRITIPRSGDSAWSGGGAQVSGSGGAGASGSMSFSAAMAALFITQVAKEAETFWRSGKCLDIKTSVESKSVGPGERVEIEIQKVEPKYATGQVDHPIAMTFDGKEKVEPGSGTSVNMPGGKVTFTAGSKENDRGTVDLKQTSERGIATKSLKFEVKPRALVVEVSGNSDPPGANLRLRAGEAVLTKGDDGVYRGTIQGNVTGTVEFLSCRKNVSQPMSMRAQATDDETDPELIHLFILPDLGIDPEKEVTCEGVTSKVPIPLSDFTLPFLGTDGSVPVRLDQPTTLQDPAFPETSVRVTVRRQEPPKS